MKFSILIARGLLWTTFSQNFFFWNITLICMLIVHNKGTFCASCQKWSFWPPKVENGRNLDLSHRILIKYTFLRSPDYALSYDIWQVIWPFEIKNLDFRVYRKIFPDSILKSCDSKIKKGSNKVLHIFIKIVQSEKMKKKDHPEPRETFCPVLIIWTISWPFCNILEKR